MVPYLIGTNQIHIFAQWVPNSGYNGLASPTTVVDTTLAVSGTQLTVSLPNFGSSDAYLITLQPGASQSSAPTITSQPANVTVTAGQTATFSVTATGTAPLSYQWQQSTDGGMTWSSVGTNSASYTTGATATANSGEAFRVILSNSAGNVTSVAARLTVNASGGGGGGGTTSGPVAIDSGGGAVGSFLADTDFSGGSTYSVTTTIDLSAVANPAPTAVYQSERYGAFSYAIPGLTPGGNYKVRLHFAEIYFTTAGQRIFNVAINGQPVLTNFDIVATAGGANKANIQQFFAQADSTGTLTITYSLGSANEPKSSGLEILPETGAGGSSYRVNAGGGATGSFIADTDFSGGTPYSTSATIDTSGVGIPAPEGVYQTERWGDFTYTITNLSAGAPYLVRLHFAEIYWTSAGQRIFNVSINGSPVLTNFDIFASAGAANKAVIKECLTTANSSGQITLGFSTVVNAAKVSGLELLKLVTAVNSGGNSTGEFAADTDFSGGTAYSTSATIDTSGVAAPAPQGVYQTERYGNFTYTIPNLSAGASYLVRLHFAEIYWTGAGQRIFNVSMNGSPVLTNFDIFASAGAANKAVIKECLTTANSSGQITLGFSTVVNDAKVSGIEIFDPPSGVPDNVGGVLQASSGEGACGATGIEALLVLGLLALRRSKA
jgi:hypothetical protein